MRGGGVNESARYKRVLALASNFHKSLAFTLAEVLITLGIIGIVAAMVIPSLINAYQKHVTVTRLKQTYAQITQAVKLSEADNGDITGWDMGSATQGNTAINSINKHFAQTYILPYLKYSRTCDSSNSYCESSGQKRNINNTGGGGTRWDQVYSAFLMTGVQLFFSARNTYAVILVDINGNSKPNMFGKDTFLFTLAKGKKIAPIVNIEKPGVYMYGEGQSRKKLLSSGYNNYLCSKLGGSVAGAYCGALIKEDGWKISKDYPW